MLKKEHLKTHRSGKYIKPDFIRPDDPQLLEMAENLINIGQMAVENNLRRYELNDIWNNIKPQITENSPLPGLIKLLDERLVFEVPEDIDFVNMRQQSFILSGQLLKHPPENETEYRDALANAMQFDLYGDLADLEKAVCFRTLSAKELLNRYNLSIVQRLLLDAEFLQITIEECDQGELRRLLKYLKFFQLLAEISKTTSGAMQLKISGPYSLFASNRKYALNLAAFFPAVVRLPAWKMHAEIKTSRSTAVLNLDQNSGLVSHYRNFSAYVPEEIKLFHTSFKEKAVDWEIVGDTPVLNGGKRQYVVPDLSFRHRNTGRICHLELFHRWHAGQLQQRLDFLLNRPDIALIIGIDRSIDSEDIQLFLEQHPQLYKRIFKFRDFPGVNTVLKTLDCCCL